MNENDNADIAHSIVAKSGFPFQMAIVRLLERKIRNWVVESTEHPWFDPHSGASGSVDIVLAHGAAVFVIECRRMTDAEWTFFVPNDHPHEVRHSDVMEMPANEWTRYSLHPASEEAEFCQFSIKGESKTPERGIATALLPAVESIARDLPRARGYWVIVPAIVTNAPLRICRFDPATVDLATGQPKITEVRSAGLVRFRRSFVYGSPDGPPFPDLKSKATAGMRTVWIINASHLLDTLNAFDLGRMVRL